MIDFAAAITSATAALDILKGLRSVEKSYDEATFKMQIADLQLAIVDAKSALVEAREAHASQQEEIASLKDAFRQRSELITAGNGYKYKPSEGGAASGFPACPKCEPQNGRIVFLVLEGTAGDRAKCPVCESIFWPVDIYEPSGQTKREAALQRQSEGMARLARINNPYY